MKKIFTLLTIALFAIGAQSQTYKVTAYYEDFSSGFSQDDSSNPSDNEYGIDFDGQQGFTTWSQDNTGSASLDNNNWWKVNAPQGRSLVSVYQGADWVRCVTPQIDISALPNPKLYFDLEVVVNASTNLAPKVEVYYTTNYSGSKFTGSPSSNGFTLLGTIDKNAANGQKAFDLPSGTNIYILFAYKSVAAAKETNGDKYWIDNIEVSQEFQEPATKAYYTENFDALTGVVQKDISIIEANTKVKVFTDVASRNWYWQNNTVKAMMDFNPTNIATPVTSWIISNGVDLSTANTTFAKVQFNQAYRFNLLATFEVLYSTDWDGSSDPNTNGPWNEVSVSGWAGAQLTSWGGSYDASTDPNYATVSGLLTDAIGESKVYVAIKATSQASPLGGHYLIDNLQVLANGDVPTAIGDVVRSQFKLYPNPVNDLLMIDGAHGAKVGFYSLSGGKVKEVVNTTGSIDVSDLNTGVYILQLNYGGSTEVVKLIKK